MHQMLPTVCNYPNKHCPYSVTTKWEMQCVSNPLRSVTVRISCSITIWRILWLFSGYSTFLSQSKDCVGIWVLKVVLHFLLACTPPQTQGTWDSLLHTLQLPSVGQYRWITKDTGCCFVLFFVCCWLFFIFPSLCSHLRLAGNCFSTMNSARSVLDSAWSAPQTVTAPAGGVQVSSTMDSANPVSYSVQHLRQSPHLLVAFRFPAPWTALALCRTLNVQHLGQWLHLSVAVQVFQRHGQRPVHNEPAADRKRRMRRNSARYK